MKIAVIQDWLTDWGGAEQVLEQILHVFPGADIFTLVDFRRDEHKQRLTQSKIQTSFIQRLPFAGRHLWYYLPLMPFAIEQFDLSPYDLVISNSHAVAKGVITGPDQVHVSFVQSPMRYAWDLQHQYLRESRLAKGVRGQLARWVLHYLRIWDVRSANGPDVLVANSRYIARRIWKTYRRHSSVIHPPVDVDRFSVCTGKSDFYLCASRVMPYKRMDVVVDAFSRMPHRRLVVIGDGPELPRLKQLAGPNVEILGYQPTDVLVEHMQLARAFVFGAEEDFGIMPVEAQACGTPVIAFGRGGALDTVLGLDNPNPTGVLFPHQTSEDVIAAVDEFERNVDRFRVEDIRRNALRFSNQRFHEECRAVVERAIRLAADSSGGSEC